MSERLSIFVSSVQKELEDERAIVQNLLSTDAFLSAHTVPLLYEFEPASADQALEGCLRALHASQVYVLIVAGQYGTRVGDLSITHTEYRCAKEAKLPILAFIKGVRSLEREAGTAALIRELEGDGFKYKRFGNVIELQKEVRTALVKLLKECFGLNPSTDENEIAQQTIEATSTFESQLLKRVPWKKLAHQVARRMIAAAESTRPEKITHPQLLAGASLRGLVWHDSSSGEHFATSAGIVMLAQDPSAVFPQCRILSDAYRGVEADGDPHDHEDIRLPMPLAVDRGIAFIDRNTRHPMKVVGLNRVRLDEYPSEALREAVVNAVAHRQYEDAGCKIMLEVFSNRVVVSSPGLPPAPNTLAGLRNGKYRPCSRNPVLAQCLSYFHRIEERGSGFRRMRDQMIDHGLESPMIGTVTGYFQVVFPGPGDNIDRITVPRAQLVVTPAIVAQLNERQKKMLQWLAEGEELTSRRCIAEFGITRPVTVQDFGKLVKLGLAERIGAGRSTKYRYKSGA